MAVDSVPAPNDDNAARRVSFLSGEGASVEIAAEPSGMPPVEPEMSSVVLSWLMEREADGAPMTVLSPLLVLLTIWEAASSAGSGMAAPASGLGTFVLLVLVDRSRLAKEHALRSGNVED
jgi:hypothetical protein